MSNAQAYQRTMNPACGYCGSPTVLAMGKVYVCIRPCGPARLEQERQIADLQAQASKRIAQKKFFAQKRRRRR